MEVRDFEGKIEIGDERDISPDTPFSAMMAVDRQAVVDLVTHSSEWQQAGGKWIEGFTITMPCGYEKRFTNSCDIPFGDLPCPCGQEEHYLIRYKKEQ